MMSSFVEYPGGAKRSDNVPYFRCIPVAGLIRLAETLQEGADKYNENVYDQNWRKATTPEYAAQCFDHAILHLYKWVEGFTDEDHLGHAMANLMFLAHFEDTGLYTPADPPKAPAIEPAVAEEADQLNLFAKIAAKLGAVKKQ